jgi:hypothetical protein
MLASDVPQPTGRILVEVFRDLNLDGVTDHSTEKIYHFEKSNLITSIGSRYIRNILGFNNVTSMNATASLSLSNDGSPLISWGKLPNELTADGLDRNTDGSVTAINDTAIEVDYTWTYIGASQQVQTTGLHYDPTDESADDLFSASDFTQVTLTTNDQIKVTWTVNIPTG